MSGIRLINDPESLESLKSGSIGAVGLHPLGEFLRGVFDITLYDYWYCDSVIGAFLLHICGADVKRLPGPDIFEACFSGRILGKRRHIIVGPSHHKFEEFTTVSRQESVENIPLPIGNSKDLSRLILDNYSQRQGDIVWVCLGCPKQDLVIKEISDHITTDVLIIAVGAAFDNYLSKTRLLRNVWRFLPFEWLWRLVVEFKKTSARLKLIPLVIKRWRYLKSVVLSCLCH